MVFRMKGLWPEESILAECTFEALMGFIVVASSYRVVSLLSITGRSSCESRTLVLGSAKWRERVHAWSSKWSDLYTTQMLDRVFRFNHQSIRIHKC